MSTGQGDNATQGALNSTGGTILASGVVSATANKASHLIAIKIG